LPAPPPRRNPQTQEKHRRETAWQIYLPLGLGVLFFLLLAVLSSLTPAAAASKWADTSLVFLLALACAPLLLLLAVTAGLAYALWEANRRLPAGMARLQRVFRQTSRVTRQACDRVSAPFIKVQQLGAALRSLGGARRRAKRLSPEEGTPHQP